MGVHQRRHSAVVFSPQQGTSPVTAGQQAPLKVPRLTVRKSRTVAEHAQPMGLVPGENAVIGNVGDQQSLLISDPHGAFKPSAPIKQTFKLGIEQHQGTETRIMLNNLGLNEIASVNVHRCDRLFQLKEPGGRLRQASSLR